MKEDNSYEERQAHPGLCNCAEPKTTNASVAMRKSREKSSDEEEETEKPKWRAKGSRKEKKRLTAFGVSEIILEKNLKTITEVHAFAQGQRDDGKTDLVQFILNKPPKSIQDLLDTTWRMKTAKEGLERAKKNRKTRTRTRFDSYWNTAATDIKYVLVESFESDECFWKVLNSMSI